MLGRQIDIKEPQQGCEFAGVLSHVGIPSSYSLS